MSAGPTWVRREAVRLPPPSLTKTASSARTALSAFMSPLAAADMKAEASLAASSWLTVKRGRVS